MNLLDLFFLITLFTTVFVYLLYPLILLIISSIHSLSLSKQKTGNKNPLRKISIIVPTYNEGAVIGSKLESLLETSYPEDLREIIVVDSGSTDNTCDVVREFNDTAIVLFQQEKRLGKANAINFALQEAKGEIVILSDANAKFKPNLLFELVQKFDDNTGAVLPRLLPSGKLSFWDKIFYEVHHVYKNLESNSDSVFIVFGELFAFRKALVTRIDEDAVSDDLEIAFTIRKKNYRIRYAPEVKVVEKIPESSEETRVQRTRRAFGILQSMKKNIDVLGNPKYGLYGVFIFPIHFVQMTIIPFFVLCLLFILPVKIAELLLTIDQVFIVPLLLFAVFGLFIISFTKAREIVLVGYNFLATQLYVIIALVDLMRGKSYRIWRKASTTRAES